MSMLGKSLKSRFLAIVLSGAMVLASMTSPEMLVSAAETSNVEEIEDVETRSETKDVSEETAEAEEVKQKDSEETETEELQSKKSDAEETTTAKKESATEDIDKEIEETKESETDSDDVEESQTDVADNKANAYSATDAVLAKGRSNAVWGLDGTIASDNNKLNQSSGTYTNATGDVLYIDATSGKFDPASDSDRDGVADRIQINATTKIYIPVKTDENGNAKIIIYQSKIDNADNVIHKEGTTSTASSFEISKDGTVLSGVVCTVGANQNKYYPTELELLLDDKNALVVICVEVKTAENYFTKIISGEEVRDDIYDDDYDNDPDLVKYNMEGYAAAAKVTGGGVMKTYYTASNAEEFLEKLTQIQAAGEPAVIKVTGDLNLGSNEVANFSNYKSVITAHKNQALMHPTLKIVKNKDGTTTGTGVSALSLKGFKDLTIFSENGAAIKHCAITISGSENIIFRNLVFDELWEWDDLVYYKADKQGNATLKDDKLQLSEGDYDRNDWDYICVDSESDGIWIDHCTFYKAYDGVIDIKNPKTGVTDNEAERVTVSWCKFEEKSAPDANGNHPFYDKQLEWLKTHINETDYYRALMAEKDSDVSVTATDGGIFTNTQNATIKGEGFSDALIESYTRGQKKTHLLGQDDNATNAVGIRATFANNIYHNSMDRMPRLRRGNAHMYNSVLDASDIYYAHRLEGGDTDKAKAERAKLDGHLVSNGAISTVDGNVFLDTCYIDGIEGAILSGNGNSKPGYIGWENCKYILGNDISELKITYKNNTDNKDYSLSKTAFEGKLPANYKYSLYSGELDNLKSYLSDKAGAGVVTMSAVQWTKTSYGSNGSTGEDPGPVTPPDTPDDPPVDPDPTEGKAFRASSLEVETLTADEEVNEFYTITKGCEIAEGKETINDIYFTKYIKLAGNGSKENSIKVTSPGKGTLTVYVASNNVSAARAAAGTLNLLDSTGSTVKDSVTDITDAAVVTLQIPEKGEYYVASEDGELHVYGMDLAAEEGAGDDENPVIEFSLRADEIAETSLTSDYEKNGFTIKVKGSTITIDNSNKGGYKKRIKMGGAATADNRSIHFHAADTGTLTVYAVSSNSEEPRILELYKYDGKQGTYDSEQGIATGSTLQELKFDITEPGDYYVAGNGGVNFYCITFSNKKEDPDEYAPAEVDAEWTTFPDSQGDYSADAAHDASKVQYNMEGYAKAANVTGGGLLSEDNPNYIKVSNELEFIQTLSSIFRSREPHVIEITKDLNLGDLELNKKYEDDKLNVTSSGDGYSNLIRTHATPLMHPTLQKTGVSYVKLHDLHNLTIFSKNGATIKHAEINIEGGSDNILIRNLTFDELWEWDEQTSGEYDRNDWDYICVDDNARGVWIDHCTFYKAYDGIIDAKNPGGNDLKIDYQPITISWCEVLPGSKDNTFFNEQMKWLEDNIERTTYYKKLRQTESMSREAVWWYAYGQKKTHLFGSDDGDSQDKAIRVTLANNYYKNAQSRLPRLRYGKVHEYNCVLDSHQMNEQHDNGNSHITGNGANSTCKGEMLLENNYIRGVRTPLRCGYGSVGGYINAVGSVYYMNGLKKELIIENSSTDGLKVTDETKFKEKLPEGYVATTYDATQLYTTVVPYAGAGKVDMTTLQWEATNYGTNNAGGETPASPSSTESSSIAAEYDKAPTFPSWGDPDDSEDESSSSGEGGSSGSETGPGETGPGETGPGETGPGETGPSETETPPSEPGDDDNEKIEDIYIRGLEPSYPYTGAKIIPDIEVWDGNTLLSPNIDYKVTYKNNVKAGTDTAKVIVTGKGNYTGKSVEKSFSITKDDITGEVLNLKGAKIQFTESSYEYKIGSDGKGEPQYPTFELTTKGADKTTTTTTYVYKDGVYKAEGTDTAIAAKVTLSNNINKGTATILIRGAEEKGKETSVKKTFKITAIDLSMADEKDIDIKPSENTEYAVKGAVPKSLTVKYKGTELKNGRDYTVKYSNNKKAEQDGTITITGKGNYAKKRTGSYSIKKLDLSNVSVKAVTAYDGIQTKKVKATVVDGNGTVLKASQYTLKIYGDVKTEGTNIVGINEYADTDPLSTGKIYVQAVAKENDANVENATKPEEFAVGINIAKAKITLIKDESGKAITKEYTGSKIELEDKELIVMMPKEADPLRPGIDYHIVSYENNINKGNATAVIKGIGAYSGTKTVKFKIVQRSVKDLMTWQEILDTLKKATDVLKKVD